MRILSENGSKLQDIYFGDVTTLRYFDPTIYLLGNKCYLTFEDSWGGDDDIMLVYSIDRNTSSIQQVAKHKGPGHREVGELFGPFPPQPPLLSFQ